MTEGNPSDTPSADAARVLCVLSSLQAEEYRDEFMEIGAGQAEFVFEPSPETALEQLGGIDPSLVIVGMDLGSMEGLEFLAMLMRQIGRASCRERV